MSNSSIPELVFVTANKNKLKEVQAILSNCNINIDSVAVDCK